jgi:hypothetical protein
MAMKKRKKTTRPPAPKLHFQKIPVKVVKRRAVLDDAPAPDQPVNVIIEEKTEPYSMKVGGSTLGCL